MLLPAARPGCVRGGFQGWPAIPYSRGPSTHGPDEIDVTTIPVPADWLADRPASGETPGRLALTETALDHLVAALAGQRVVGVPRNLSPYAMVALLDAAWPHEEPWRELVRSRLQERGQRAGWWPHRDVQQHLDELQAWWDRLWFSRDGDRRLTNEEVTDEMVDRWWEAWMDEQADRDLRILANPGRLGVEQIAQITRAAIQWVARDPGDRLRDDLIDDMLAEVEAEVTAAPARPEAGDPEASPASVVPDMVDEYLIARREWEWPPGRAGAWAVGQVVDRHLTLGMAAAAREEGHSAFACRRNGSSGNESGRRGRYGRPRTASRGCVPMSTCCWPRRHRQTGSRPSSSSGHGPPAPAICLSG